MAKKYIDTATGEMSADLSALKGVNIPKKGGKVKGVVSVNEPDNSVSKEFEATNAEHTRVMYNPQEALKDYSPDAVENIGGTGVGQSRYDEDITSRYELDNLQNTRAKLQPWYEQIGTGIAKGTVLAGTTFSDGILGTAVGLFNVAVGGEDGKSDFSDLWNNPFSNAMQDINKWSEEAIPNYYTDDEKANDANGEWYKNAFSANFIGDKVLKNLGFAIGAGLAGKVSAGVMSKAMMLGDARLAFKGAAAAGQSYEDVINAFKTGDKVLDGVKLNEELFSAARRLKAADPILKLTGGLSGAIGEGRIEAISNSEDFFNAQKQKVDGAKEQMTRQLTDQAYANGSNVQFGPNGISLRPEIQANIDKIVEDKYKQGIDKITNDRLKMGNVDFALNIPLLTLSDMWQFGKFYAGGYNNARKLSKNIIGGIERGVNEAGEQIATGAFKANLPGKAMSALKLLSNPIVEGNEEMSQQAIALGSGYKYEKELDSFLAGKLNPKAEESTVNYIKSMGSAMVKGVKDTYGEPSQWEQFAIGAFTGAIGIPGFKSLRGEDGKFQSPIHMEGGIMEDYRENKATKEETHELVNKLNSRVNSPEFQNYYSGVVRHNAYEAAKTQAVKDADPFNYKNAEHAQLISDAVLFDKAGRIQDLYDNIESASALKPEDVAKVRELSINKETGKSVFDGMLDPQVIEQVRKEGVTAKEAVDDYRKVSDALRVKTGDQLHEDELHELTYMMTHINDWEKRFTSLHSDIKETLHPVLSQFADKTYEDKNGEVRPLTDILNLSPVEMLSTLQHESIGLENKVIAARMVTELQGQDLRDNSQSVQDNMARKIDNSRSKQAFKLMDKLQDLTKAIESNKELAVKYSDIIPKINDMTRIAAARIDFIDKYDGYTRNPEALRQHLANTTQEAVAAQQAKTVEEASVKVKAATNYSEFKQAVNSADTDELKHQLINDEIAAKNPIAIEYKKVTKAISDLYTAIENVTGVTQEQRDLARRILKSKLANIETVATLLNKNTYNDISDDNLWVNPNTGETTDPTDMQTAQNIIGTAINAVLKNTTVETNLNDLFKSEQTAANTEVKEEETIPHKEATPVFVGGETTVQGLIDGNNSINTEVNTLNQPVVNTNGTKDWVQVIHEIDIDKIKRGEVAYIGDLEDKKAYHAIYNYIKDNGGFDYVNQGKLKKGSQVQFMIDPAWESLDPNNVGTIFITQDGVVLGAIDRSAYRMAQFAGMTEFATRFRAEYEASRGNNIDKINKLEKNRDKDLNLFEIPDKIKGREKSFYWTNVKELTDSLYSEFQGVMENNTSIQTWIDKGFSSIIGTASDENREIFKNSVIQLINNWYNSEILKLGSNKSNDKFISKESNEVSTVYPGRLNIRKGTNFEKSLREITGVLDGDNVSDNVIFGVMQKGQIITNRRGVVSETINGLALRGGNNEGRLYLLVKGADNKYYPTLVKTKRFDSVDFNLDSPTVQNTQRYKRIMSITTDMCSATDSEEFTRHFNILNNELYLGNFHINYNEDGNGIITIRKGTAEAGPQIKTRTLDYSKGADTGVGIKTGSPLTFTPFEQVREDVKVPVEQVVRQVLDAIQKEGTYLQIDKNAINKGTYNSEIVKDDILTSNLASITPVGAGFSMRGKDEVGKILESKKVETPKVANPATAVHEVVGTTINYSGGTYTVNDRGEIFNDKGNLVDQLTEAKSVVIKDIAWVTELNSGKYGTNIGDKKVTLSWDGKAKEADYYLVPSGKILRYRSDSEYSYVTGHQETAARDAFGRKEVLTKTILSTPKVTTTVKAIDVAPKTIDVDKTIPIVGAGFHSKFDDLDKTKDKIGYYLDGKDKVTKDYIRPLGTFIVNGQSISVHYARTMFNGAEAFMGIIDSNGKRVGMASDLETLRESINKNQDILLARSKESSPLTANLETKEVTTAPESISKPSIQTESQTDKATDSEVMGDELLSSMNKPRRKRSTVNADTWEVWDKTKELEHLNKILPNVMRSNLLKIHKGLIEVNSKGGAAAWGIYKDGLITISDIATKGTVYHEAFHLVMDKFLSTSEKASLFAEARNKWGALTQDVLEEKLADAYRDYTLSEVADKSLGRRIVDFFKSILGLSKANKPLLDSFFWNINQGKYSDKEITSSSKNKSVKSLANSNNLHIFANLDSETRRLLEKKGINYEVWSNLNKAEKENELKCVTI